MKVKICGVTSLEDAAACVALGADMIGIVHVPGRMRSLPAGRISEIFASLGQGATRVLVCAPRGTEEAIHLFEASGADVLQAHSLEPEEILDLRDADVTVFRAVPPDRSEAVRFAGSVDALVFEGGTPGTGSSYDYSQVPVDCCAKAIVSGGLTPENLHIARALHPYALDVSSGVECSPGRKDRGLVAEFIERCHK